MKALEYKSNLNSEKLLGRLRGITGADDSLDSLLSKKAFYGVVKNNNFELYTFFGGVFIQGEFNTIESCTIIKTEVSLLKHWEVIHKIVLYSVSLVSLVTLIDLIRDNFQNFEFGQFFIPFILVSIYYMPKITVNQQSKYLTSVFARYLDAILIDTKPNIT